MILMLAALGSAAQAAAPEAPGETFPVSTSATGELADGDGATQYGFVSISEDGRFVGFESAAGNLGEAGPAGVKEGFVKNLETGRVNLASVADGAGGEAAAAPGITTFALSENGRYVIFTSAATNLGTTLPAEEAEEPHVYRRDLRTGETTLVDRITGSEGAILSRGAEATSISANGRYAAFVAHVANLEDPSGDHAETANPVGYVRDLQSGTTTAVTRASGANGELGNGELLEGLSLSRDGREVAFGSTGNNLVPGASEGQVYLRDLGSNTTTLLSKNAAGEAGDRTSGYPTFSGGEGCFVEFSSIAFNLIEPDPTAVSGEQAYVVDRCAGPSTIDLISRDATHPIASGASGSYRAPVLSADGSEALFGGYFGNFGPYRLYLRDRAAGTTGEVDRASGEGTKSDAEIQFYAISANGCRVVFGSAATNLSPGVPAGSTQVYVRQLKRCAPPAQDANVRIEGRAETLFEGVVPVTVHKIRASSDLEERYCDGINELDPQNTEPDVTPTLASAEAMESIGETFDGEWYTGFGDYFITRWGPDEQDNSTAAYWGIIVNEVFTNVGGCQYQLDEDDQVLWVYDAFQGRPSVALFPEEAHYTSGPRPTEATATVGVPFPVEVIGYEDDLEDIPGEEPSRDGSRGYPKAEVAPVRTNAKGFQLVETSSPETVLTDSEGKASIVFTTPGVHRIKATVGEPGHESVIRSNGIDVDVLPGETGPPPPAPPSGGPAPAGEEKGQPNPAPPAPATKGAARVSRPRLDRSGLAQGRLRIDWKILSPGAGVKRWSIESKTLGRRGAKFSTRARGRRATAATIHLPRGNRYRLRFSLLDRSGHTTRYPLGTITVPRGRHG